MRKNNIIPFRRRQWARGLTVTQPRRVGDFRWVWYFLPILLFVAVIPETHAGNYRGSTTSPASLVRVSWVDGDSGTINGKAFRLYGVDAPEGSPSRARCTYESEKSKKSAQAARKMTSSGRVSVKKSHGYDKYDRELIELSVDGRDIARQLVAQGHLKNWDYPAQRKPNWC